MNHRWIETGFHVWQLEMPVGSKCSLATVWGDVKPPRWSLPLGCVSTTHGGRTVYRGCGECMTVSDCMGAAEQETQT